MVILRNRSLAALVVAELVSLTGSAMTFVALPWFVLVTTGSTAKMGWVLAAELIPVGVFGIPAGTLVARLGAKRTMNISDAARGPLIALVPILHWSGDLSFPLLLAITFATGCFLAPYYASARLILPEVIGEHEQLVAQGSAFVQMVTQLTQLGGQRDTPRRPADRVDRRAESAPDRCGDLRLLVLRHLRLRPRREARRPG